MQTTRYVRKPFFVEAVQVTEHNMAEVAAWCEGIMVEAVVSPHESVTSAFVKVDVHNPLNNKQTQAFVGDWVLWSRGFKVYTNKAFSNTFNPVEKKVEKSPERINEYVKTGADEEAE